MAYGELKVDSITFTDGGTDTTVSVSGLVQNPTFSGDITVTGTISGDVILGGTTVSGATVTGTAGEFGTVTGNTAGFTTVTGTTVTGDAAQFTSVTGGTAGFTTVTGTTVTGTTANFVTVSGTAITGNTAGFTTVTGTTVTGGTGNFTSISATTTTITSGVFASGTAAAPSVSVGTTDNGLYSPGTDEVAISTNGTERMRIDSSGRVGINTIAPTAGYLLDVNGGIRTNAPSQLGLRLAANSAIRDDSAVQSTMYFDVSFGGSPHGNFVWRSSLNATERARIDTSGRFLVGTSSGTSNGKLVVNGGAVFTNVNTQTISTASYVDLEVMRFLVNKGNYIEESFSGDVTVHVKAQRGASVNNVSCQALKCFVTLGSFSNFNDIRMIGEVKSIDSTVLQAGTSPGTLTVALVLESSVDGGSTWTALAATTSTDTTNATALIRLRANLTGTPPSSMSTITTTTSVSGLVVGNISVNSTTITTA